MAGADMREKKADKEKSPAAVVRVMPLAVVDTGVIYCGDCLGQLKRLPDKCVDLVYIDPPFNSNRNYEVVWGRKKEKRAFDDRHANMQAYIDFMRPRCAELARTLKKAGAFYYHCDWHAGHYVKVMLDRIFGAGDFQNEIVWKRTHAHGGAKRYGCVHDVIFYYAGGGSAWNRQYLPYTPEYVGRFFRFTDPDGRRYRSTILTGPGKTKAGSSGRPWRGIDPGRTGRHWAIPGYMRGLLRKSETVQDALDQLDKMGRVIWPGKKGGIPSFKQYLDDMDGAEVQDVWTDIPPISAQAEERLGYPTQKPLALLERIIKASSNENDVVLDAFCGCGTALAAAQNLKRRWIGMDISPAACRVAARRLRDTCGLKEGERSRETGRGFVVRDLP
jgi:DNA modification methylase